MRKKMTITLDETVYEALHHKMGRRRMGQFIEDVLRPHVMNSTLDAGYAAMAADIEREAEAIAWGNCVARETSDDVLRSLVG